MKLHWMKYTLYKHCGHLCVESSQQFSDDDSTYTNTTSRKIHSRWKCTLYSIHFWNFPFEIARKILPSHSNRLRLFIFAFRRGVCISRRHECMQTSFSGWIFFTDRLTPLNNTHIIYIRIMICMCIIIFSGAFWQNVTHVAIQLWFTMNARKVYNSYRRQIIRIGFEIVQKCKFMVRCVKV